MALTAGDVLDRFEREMTADEDLRDVVAMARPIRHMYDPNTLVATLDHLLAAYARARGARIVAGEPVHTPGALT